MAYVRVAHRGYPARPPLANYPIMHRIPIQHQHLVRHRHNAPRHVPVLHAPTYPGEYDFFGGEEEEQQLYGQDPYQHPEVLIPDQYRRSKYHSTKRTPTFMSLQNYYKRSSTRSSGRYVQPKYSSYTYYRR
ncbi:unnamed protein product [Rotaria sp. Silwood2]|nr:unnamed protein product [Rotaria sp. Silwood2]CAF3242351.1 unnamed protein product [Rotaria sp. Silwood2]CAF3344502.1 unnamed protein product [Rotaria sp. Silwood2]CAF4035149.1 unnamed protein product [Rotaria sp. Silwood2]CAF4163783.1 unnamed protein product [Rotaria sp. Silwood2]